MSRPLFMPEELEELARIDAELEAAPVTADELADSRRRDRAAKLDSMDKRTRRIAEQQRQYYEAHREAIAERAREYRAANKEAIAERAREYYAANKEAIAEYQREYYAANKETIAERAREYYAANKEAIAEYQREYYAANKETIAEYQREYYPGYYYAARPRKDDIRARRQALRVTQAELAHRVGVSQSLICMIEKGRCGVVPQTMRMIEEALEEMEGAMT